MIHLLAIVSMYLFIYLIFKFQKCCIWLSHKIWLLHKSAQIIPSNSAIIKMFKCVWVMLGMEGLNQVLSALLAQVISEEKSPQQ